MGRMKTDRTNAVSEIKRAHKMAESFAQHKTKEFLTRFLNNSGLVDLFFDMQTGETKKTRDEILESMLDDLNLSFGGELALAYAMGFMDKAQKKSLKTLYVPGKLAEEPKEDGKIIGLDGRPMLPGFEN